MGVCLPFQACDPSMGIGSTPLFSFPAPLAQEPPPPYTPAQPTVTTNQPTQLDFVNGIPGGAVNRVPRQGQALTGNPPLWDNRMPLGGYIVRPPILSHPCSCAQCNAVAQ